jgi:hypothetical protein
MVATRTSTAESDADARRFELAKLEYFHLNKSVESYDPGFLQIKAWSVSLGTGGILFAMGLKTNTQAAFLAVALLALCFWLIEGVWKAFQSCHYRRLRKVEDYLAGREVGPFDVPDLHQSWFVEFRGDRLMPFRKMVYANVFLPHAVVLGAALALAAFGDDFLIPPKP